jgi:hypothetical protein
MLGNPKHPPKKRLKLSLNSHITVNLIDVIHLELHPAFVRPEGMFSIRAIGEQTDPVGQADIFNIYAENNGCHYLIEIEAVEENIKSVSFYQNVLSLQPDEDEWAEAIRDISLQDIEIDDVSYSRALGGDAEVADLCNIVESLLTGDGQVDCSNKLMLFERKINPGDFIEKLKAVIEVVESNAQAGLSFYVGFQLHPSSISILGN